MAGLGRGFAAEFCFPKTPWLIYMSNPFAEHPWFTEQWSEVIAMSEDDAAVELVAAVRDIWTAYRWAGIGDAVS